MLAGTGPQGPCAARTRRKQCRPGPAADPEQARAGDEVDGGGVGGAGMGGGGGQEEELFARLDGMRDLIQAP